MLKGTMTVEGDFVFQGTQRWNLGWPTPNYAGAFLVTLLCLAWAVRGRSPWRLVILIGEASLCFLIAKTYSRGAVVAWAVAWAFGVAVTRGWNLPVERIVWAGRVVVLAAMMLATGFGWSRSAQRLNEVQSTPVSHSSITAKAPMVEQVSTVPSADGSVMNRVALWRGGLMMIAAAPWTGWGAGESGRSYMNWYQDVDRNEGYTTMVNSYMHVAVEHGLPILVAILWIGLSLISVPWRGVLDDANMGSDVFGMTRSSVVAAAGATLVAWMIANIFTTLWIDPKLWIVPSVACLVLIWCARTIVVTRLIALTVASLGIAIFAGGGLYGVGRWLSREQTLFPAPCAGGSVVLTPATLNEVVWHTWPDPVVLGRTPGKELRRWLVSKSANIQLVVHCAAPLRSRDVPAGADRVVLFGRQVEWIGHDLSAKCRELWLIHPTVGPRAVVNSQNQLPPRITVVLPQIDEMGNTQAWRRWAQENRADLLESSASGLDVRVAWPEILSRDSPALRRDSL